MKPLAGIILADQQQINHHSSMPRKGHAMSAQQKEKIRIANTGQKRPWARKNLGDVSGSRNGRWKGGVRSLPHYSTLQRLKRHETEAGRPRPNACEVCGRTGTVYFDHDHATGKFRGWLCNHCNLILGHAKDSVDLLRSLIQYLNP
jgi:Recombination endonuclease VII